MDKREHRKWAHLKHSLEIPDGPLSTGFENLHLIHQALSCCNLAEINTTTNLLGKKQQFPLIINAITGGAQGLDKINEKLAFAAQECGIGLAVGSQTAAIKNRATRNTFEIVRKVNPHGLIIANISALTTADNALEAVEMIEADGLQLHLNLAQELAMSEGDRDFKHLIEKIASIKEKISVPVIVKEVGFGLSLETVNQLKQIGIKYIDIGGAGGTNFAAIEQARNESFTNPYLINWGIPTVISLVEALSVYQESQTYVIASGGVRTALDIVKSLVLGAEAVGIAYPILEIACRTDDSSLINYLNDLFNQTKELMLLVGGQTIKELRNCPLIFTGFAKEWLELRGFDLTKYGQRKMRKQPLSS